MSKNDQKNTHTSSVAKVPARLGALLRRLHGSLSLDLRHRDYPIAEEELYWATLGHCYIATEALYYLWGKEAGYVPFVLRHQNGSHWWLVHPDTGDVIDPTLPQLHGEKFPYDKGHKQQFLTAAPSNRTRELMRRMSSKPGT